MYPLMERERVAGGDYKRGPSPPSFWRKKNRRRKKSRQGKRQIKKPGPPLAQGLDPPLHILMPQSDWCEIHTQMRRSDWYEQHTTLHANIKLLKKKKKKKKRILTKNEMLMWLVFALFCCHKTKDRRH